LDDLERTDEAVLEKVHSLAKIFINRVDIDDLNDLDVSPKNMQNSPENSRRDISYQVENKDNFFADLKKKRQNVLSNHSSKSTDGFKLII
jgi:hypothetical protein